MEKPMKCGCGGWISIIPEQQGAFGFICYECQTKLVAGDGFMSKEEAIKVYKVATRNTDNP